MANASFLQYFHIPDIDAYIYPRCMTQGKIIMEDKKIEIDEEFFLTSVFIALFLAGNVFVIVKCRYIEIYRSE